MADFFSKFLTNSFHVTDEEAFKKMMDKVEANYLMVEHEKGNYCIYGEGPLYAYDDQEESVEDSFFLDLSKILPEKEVLLWHEIGNEKFRYLSSGCWIVMRNHIEYVDLLNETIAKVRTKLKDESFKLDLFY